MKPHPKTLVLVALASGMLASAYFIGPAPAATAVPAEARPIPSMAMAAAPSKPASTIKTLRAPVPLLVGRHDQFFDMSSVPDTAAPTQTASATANESPQAPAASSDSTAKASIEMDGYRNVRGLVRASNGAWHARAMRGSTEIAVVVDPNGNVSQD